MPRWIRSRALYTPPVTPWELVLPEVVALTACWGERLRSDRWLGWSRNKVAVGEPAAGSPPLTDIARLHLCMYGQSSTFAFQLGKLGKKSRCTFVRHRFWVYSLTSPRSRIGWFRVIRGQFKYRLLFLCSWFFNTIFNNHITGSDSRREPNKFFTNEF